MLVHDNNCDEIPDDDRYFLEDAYLRVELEIRRTCQRNGLDTSRHYDRRGLMTEPYASEDNTLRHHHYTTDDNGLEENDFEMVIDASKQLEHELRTYVLVDGVNNDETTNIRKAGLLEMIQEVQRKRLFSPSIIGDMFRFLKVRNKLVHDYHYNALSFRDPSTFHDTQQRISIEMEPYLPPHALRRRPRRQRRRHNQAPPQTEYCFFAMMACVIEDSTTDAAPMSRNLGVVNDRKVCHSIDTSRSPTKLIRGLAAIGLWKQTSCMPGGVVLRNFCGFHPTWLVLILVVLVLVLVLAWAKRHESTTSSLWLLAILVLTIGAGLYRVTVYDPIVCEQNHRAWRHVATMNGRFACDLFAGKPFQATNSCMVVKRAIGMRANHVPTCE